MKSRACIGVIVGLLACAGTGGAWYYLAEPAPRAPEIKLLPAPPEASRPEVERLCGACHACPTPDVFPKSAWRKEVRQAFEFFRDSTMEVEHFPSLESVAQYYEQRAPADIPIGRSERGAAPSPLQWERTGYPLPGGLGVPAVANVNLVHLFQRDQLDVLVCDMRHDRVLVLRPYEQPPRWQELGQIPAPAHAEVVDLDGDGILDVIVASLGNFYPTNGLVGSVVWLRGNGDGTFTPIPLLTGVGRVADVQAADFNGDGKLDLIVAEFGWRSTGSITYLENQTTDWKHPVFKPHVVDDHHGTIHVPVCDLNQDGRPDFVALISQEHERIVAFLNEGGGRFRKELIYAAPHPAFGSSGIQLVDMNGDGKLDVLYTNGDTLDHNLPKPYHGIQWLENRGAFPFVPHPVAPMYGVMRAVAADLDGDGRIDIVGVSYLNPEGFPQRAPLHLEAINVFLQSASGAFVKHTLTTGSCDHFTCAVGDLRANGTPSLVVGNHFFRHDGPAADAVEIWNFTGKPARGRQAGS